jgi:hypothetical protein
VRGVPRTASLKPLPDFCYRCDSHMLYIFPKLLINSPPGMCQVCKFMVGVSPVHNRFAKHFPSDSLSDLIDHPMCTQYLNGICVLEAFLPQSFHFSPSLLLQVYKRLAKLIYIEALA